VAGSLLVAIVGNPMAAVGYLAAFPVHPSRGSLEFATVDLADRVADNTAKYDLTETDPLIVGQGFGIATDMKLSPQQTVYVVSHSNGAVYEVSGPGSTDPNDPDISGIGPLLRATLTPGGDQDAAGTATLRLHSGRELVCYELRTVNVSLPATVGIFQGGTQVLNLATTGGTISSGCVPASNSVIQALRQNPAGHSISVRNSAFPEGAMGGPLQ
jgi:hypothetical protein